MSLFRDEKLEEMSWIARVTESIDSMVNKALADLPDEIDLTESDDVLRTIRDYGSIRIDGILTRLQVWQETTRTLSYGQYEQICSCFRLSVSQGTTVDFRGPRPTVNGSILLIKVKKALEEHEVGERFGDSAFRLISSARLPQLGGFARANEIADILECPPEVFKTRSPYRKMNGISAKLKSLVKTNKWRIKNEDLMISISSWIKAYIEDGNLAALANMCKLKVMTHSDEPIYSVEEEK